MPSTDSTTKNMNHLIVKNPETGEVTECERAVDGLAVGGTFRWADRDGNHHEVRGAQIQKATGKIQVGAKTALGEKRVFEEVRMFSFDPDGGVFYITGPQWMDQLVGEVVRVRDTSLPRK